MKYEVSELLIHKKSKSFIRFELYLKEDKPTAAVYESNDGIKFSEQILDAAYLDSFPKLTGNRIVDVSAILKHFKAHGFKTISTITHTSKGIKFS